jgi:hypothetical protein
MLFRFRNLVLAAAALCSTSAFAAHEARLDVPFSFTVNNHAYQAGLYIVAVDLDKSLVTLKNITGPTHSLMWIVGHGVHDTDPLRVRITFDNVGSDHILRSIQYGELITPNLDGPLKYKVESTTIIRE